MYFTQTFNYVKAYKYTIYWVAIKSNVKLITRFSIRKNCLNNFFIGPYYAYKCIILLKLFYLFFFQNFTYTKDINI